MLAAAVVTAAFLPSLLRNPSPQRQPATASAPGNDLGVGRSQTTASTSPNTVAEIGYLSGPSSTVEPAPVLIGVPAPAPPTQSDGLAAWRAFPLPWYNLPRPCVSRSKTIPGGTTVRVTNLNNGRTTTCVVATQLDLAAGHVLAISDKVFEDIADLIESPIPVRVNW